MVIDNSAAVRDTGLARVVDTAASPRGQQFDTWRDLVYQTCGSLCAEGEHDGTFKGTMLIAGLGSVQVTVVQADAHTVARTERQVRRSLGERFYLCAPLDGNVWLIQDGRHSTAGPGELVAFDNTRAYSFAAPQPIRMVVLMFSHRVVSLTPGATHQLTAYRWGGKKGLSALLSRMIVGLGQHLTELSAFTADGLGHSIASLTSILFAERLNATAADAVAARHVLILRIQAFARSQLDSPRLDPGALADRHNISLRYLQLLFQEQGVSPARWIRQERLSRCAEDLRNPRFAHLTVALIGERRGLPGASHFSRLFRERYGVTPREFRREQQLAA